MSAEARDMEPAEDEQDFEEFEEDGDEDKGLSGLVVLTMGIVMLSAVVSIVLVAYHQGVKHRPENGARAEVVAPQPLKIEKKPQADAGNERAVYDKIDGKTPQTEETLAEGPEAPIDRQSAADPIADLANVATKGAGAANADVNDRIEQLAKEDEAAHNVPGKSAVPLHATPSNVAVTQLPAAQTKPAAAAPPPVATKPEPKPAVKPAAVAAGGGALSGTHLVQVGAFGSTAEANGVWTRLQAKFGDVLGGKSSDIERADLGAKGVFYRLRVGPYASAADAKSACESLKSKGQDCLIKAK